MEVLTEQVRSGEAPLDEGSKSVQTLTVIFPAFNEEQNIAVTVESACVILPQLSLQWEIIIVNDGSSDSTCQVCDQLVNAHPQVRVIHHSRNRGYGAALKSGVSAARHELIFFTDSDGQFTVTELPKFIEYAKEFDIVAGYRAKRNDPPHRIVNALGWNLLVRIVLGIHIRDIDCAYKLFRREVFERIQIRSVGAMVNTEIMAQAMKFSMRLKEVEVSHFPRRFGRPTGANIKVIFKAFRELFKLWWKLKLIDPDQDGIFVKPIIAPANIPSSDTRADRCGLKLLSD
jgi:glycosyltransferase involved in cell wall biosynthesis